MGRAGGLPDRSGRGGAVRAGAVRARAGRGADAGGLADLLGHLLQPALQRTGPGDAGQRRRSAIAVGLPDAGQRAVAGVADRRRRCHVPDAAAQRHRGARRPQRPRLLGLSVPDAVRAHRLLRIEQPWRRDPGRHAVYGDPRRAPRGDRCEDGGRALECRGGRIATGILPDAGSARRQGQGHRRHRRGRAGHSRVHLGPRCGDRGRGVAVLDHPGARRAGARDVGAVSLEPHDVLRSRGLDARRRVRLVDRVLRSGTQPDLLGHRQSGARLQP